MPDRIARSVTLAIAAMLATCAVSAAAEPYGIGRPATPQEIAGWDIDVSPSGAGLPPGPRRRASRVRRSSPRNARAAMAPTARASRWTSWWAASARSRDMKPDKTVGSFWPYATTLFDYVRRAMPLNAPQSLTSDEVYAVSAYVLFLNGIVPQGTHARRGQSGQDRDAQPRRLRQRLSIAGRRRQTLAAADGRARACAMS